MDNRPAKMDSLIGRLVAEFLSRQSSNQSLITVNGCRTSADGRRTEIFVSVWPEQARDTALSFAKRKRGEMRDYIKKNSRLRSMPHLDITLVPGSPPEEPPA